jgi:hypothetical protein
MPRRKHIGGITAAFFTSSLDSCGNLQDVRMIQDKYKMAQRNVVFGGKEDSKKKRNM